MIKRIVILAIFVVCLYLEGCSVIGYSLGRPSTIQRELSLQTLKDTTIGIEIMLTTPDEKIISGYYMGYDRMTLDDYCSEFQQFLSDYPEDSILPHVNEDITILSRGKEYPGRLLGYDAGIVIVKLQIKDSIDDIELKYIDIIKFGNNNNQIAAESLSAITNRITFPVVTKVSIQIGDKAMKIPSNKIKHLSTLRKTDDRFLYSVIGAAIDLVFIGMIVNYYSTRAETGWPHWP